ncbi:3-hydroxyisobutyryl-CoA hydrolase, mitochondrial [Neolecta irregularis DAH-3]|uniref:3-hydroxyisobutyryl-CoA hydrolase n=1 Tax=Neolecta irregularis (strain DAH-3) TaxID=1198029 RepID=A0A1U7LHV1_NEOID|nr:3-hydroxyisobutyryl-CoA hydrolase, mitochondrial [Neolecta irregularis DAH-3]|eukprot:OLL22224.1 3-hydroxyisobutyryl-CoA hydrolase, mitochondrial [Neolecta irregularis DAH-3]
MAVFCRRLAAMPLRAKITIPSQTRSMSSKNDSDQVLFTSNYGVRTVILNSPRNLHALDLEMIEGITPRLLEWENSELAKIIVLKSNGTRAFCAGGDVKSLVTFLQQKDSAGISQAVAYFRKEYQLDHTIATYSKPCVAFMDGITMGGGAGLSMHAPFRIATENTIFAMPETAIGLFPDVGGAFFLSRLEGQLGKFLGVTSERVSAFDCLLTGIATHYVSSSNLSALEARLAELESSDLNLIDQTIAEFSGVKEPSIQLQYVGKQREAIDRCFAGDTIDTILSTLRSEKSPWSQKQIETIQSRSPTSVAFFLRHSQEAKSWSIDQTFSRDLVFAKKFMEHPDFVEGVTARLFSSPPVTPTWTPASFGELRVSHIARFFEQSPDDPRLNLPERLNRQINYEQYPHAEYGLPTEEEIRKVITGQDPDAGASAFTANDVVEFFQRRKNGKTGVREKVLDIVGRKGHKNEEQGVLEWIGRAD